MDRTSRFAEMDRVFAEMDRRFDDVRRSLTASASDRTCALPDASDEFDRHDVAIDLHETDDGFVLYADLPGFEREEIGLTVDDGVLALDAVHEIERDGFSRSRRVSEYVTRPASVEQNAITASYRSGVLELSLPVADALDDARTIPIEDRVSSQSGTQRPFFRRALVPPRQLS
jgi:HSP20 family protein